MKNIKTNRVITHNMESIENYIANFLKNNGFSKMERFSYANDLCNIKIAEEGYEVSDNLGNQAFSLDYNVYWLIGYLTCRGFISKNYNDTF